MKVKKLIVSPSKRYVCNTGKFLEINKAAFGAKFYFTDYKGNILYCVKNALSIMNEQRLVLQTTFNDWRGELEQVDDVCIIGIRL